MQLHFRRRSCRLRRRKHKPQASQPFAVFAGSSQAQASLAFGAANAMLENFAASNPLRSGRRLHYSGLLGFVSVMLVAASRRWRCNSCRHHRSPRVNGRQMNSQCWARLEAQHGARVSFPTVKLERVPDANCIANKQRFQFSHAQHMKAGLKQC